MSHGSELKSRNAQALRAAGYVPLPRWWATREQLDLIAYMLRENAEEISRIKAKAQGHAQGPRMLTKEEEIERAWKKMMDGRAKD